MYYHISGIVSELEPYVAVIDCGGVGYLLNVSLNTLACLKVGERAKLYVGESFPRNLDTLLYLLLLTHCDFFSFSFLF